jgi:hypothetical protein
MNWGKGIIIALGAFITFIVVLVIGFFSHSVDLQSENYYELEIGYEDEIQALNNAQKLEEQIRLSLNDDYIIVNIPKGSFEDVQLEMLRPDDKKLDRVFDITGTKMFTVPRSDFKKGKYKVSISYKLKGKVCLQKNDIYIQ